MEKFPVRQLSGMSAVHAPQTAAGTGRAFFPASTQGLTAYPNIDLQSLGFCPPPY